MSVRVRLYRPADPIGRLICWRLESAYSHATIEIDGTIYSATFPRVVAVGLDDMAFGMPPRVGAVYDVRLSDAEKARALAYCRSMVGTSYDVLSMMGWALRVQSMQRPGHAYCFEYVYDALAAAGVFPTSKRLVTGDQLLTDCFAAHLIDEPPMGTMLRARMQSRAVKISAPKV